MVSIPEKSLKNEQESKCMVKVVEEPVGSVKPMQVQMKEREKRKITLFADALCFAASFPEDDNVANTHRTLHVAGQNTGPIWSFQDAYFDLHDFAGDSRAPHYLDAL